MAPLNANAPGLDETGVVFVPNVNPPALEELAPNVKPEPLVADGFVAATLKLVKPLLDVEEPKLKPLVGTVVVG